MQYLVNSWFLFLISRAKCCLMIFKMLWIRSFRTVVHNWTQIKILCKTKDIILYKFIENNFPVRMYDLVVMPAISRLTTSKNIVEIIKSSVQIPHQTAVSFEEFWHVLHLNRIKITKIKICKTKTRIRKFNFRNSSWCTHELTWLGSNSR